MTPYKYILTLCALAMSVPMFAQNKTVTLRQCVDQALENNLLVRKQQLLVEKARDLQGTAVNLEKTSFSLSQDPTSGGSPDNGLTVSQSFAFPTIYKARRKYLKAETSVAQSQKALAEQEIRKEVSSSYCAWLCAQHTLSVLLKQDSIYRQFVSLAEKKRKAGETNALEVINAQRLLNDNGIALEKKKNEAEALQLMLQQLMNTQETFTPAEGVDFVLQTKELSQDNFSQTPWGRSYEAQIESCERNVALSKQGFLPDFNVGITSQALIKGFNPYNIERERFSKGNFMGFEVGISIPVFWGSQRAKVKAANRDLQIMQMQRTQAERQLATQNHIAKNEYSRARQTLAFYKQHALEETIRMSTLAQANYVNGEISYVEYIQCLTSSLEVQLAYADAVNDYNQAIINLNYLSGNNE